jgi:hypothetical protein
MRRPSRLPTLEGRLVHPRRWFVIALTVDLFAVAAAVLLCFISYTEADADARFAQAVSPQAAASVPGAK